MVFKQTRKYQALQERTGLLRLMSAQHPLYGERTGAPHARPRRRGARDLKVRAVFGVMIFDGRFSEIDFTFLCCANQGSQHRFDLITATWILA